MLVVQLPPTRQQELDHTDHIDQGSTVHTDHTDQGSTVHTDHTDQGSICPEISRLQGRNRRAVGGIGGLCDSRSARFHASLLGNTSELYLVDRKMTMYTFCFWRPAWCISLYIYSTAARLHARCRFYLPPGIQYHLRYFFASFHVLHGIVNLFSLFIGRPPQHTKIPYMYSWYGDTAVPLCALICDTVLLVAANIILGR